MPPTVPMQYWIGPYRRVFDASIGEHIMAPPEGFAAAVDLRAIGDIDINNMGGHGFFALPAAIDPGSDYALVGDSLTAETSRTPWLDRVADVDGDTVVDRLWSALTDASDPKGANGPKTITPNSRGVTELHLAAHSIVRPERYGPGSRHAAKVESIARDTLRKAPPAMRAKLLGAMMLKYRMGEADAIARLVPRSMRVKPEPPTTTFTDDFNRASMGANWGDYTVAPWTIASNEAKSSNNGNYATYQTALSVDDMYSQVVLRNTNAQIDAGTNAAGVVRSGSGGGTTAADGAYRMIPNRDTPTGYMRIFRQQSGSTLLGTDNTFQPSQGTISRTTADGSSISGAFGGTTYLTVTDAIITGNLYPAIGGNNQALLDDWEAADIIAAASAFPFQRYYAQAGTL